MISLSVEGEASGVYCGVCILLRQLEVEGCADLVTTAQKLRQKRPAIITNKVPLPIHLAFCMNVYSPRQNFITYVSCFPLVN